MIHFIRPAYILQTTTLRALAKNIMYQSKNYLQITSIQNPLKPFLCGQLSTWASEWLSDLELLNREKWNVKVFPLIGVATFSW